MKKIVHILVLLALAFSLVMLSSCTKKDRDGNLSVYHVWWPFQDDLKTLDPANAYDVVSSEVVANIYETLYQYAYLSSVYKPEPLLAADMPKYSADKLTLTIPLKHGIMFQDDPCFPNGKGREVLAQDYVYEFKRLALPAIQSNGWWTMDGKIKGINAFHDKLAKASKTDFPKAFDEEIEGVKALDNYTLQIKLVKPYPQLQWVLMMNFTSPLPHEAIEKYGDENGNLTDHAVGTGAFVLAEWNRAKNVRLVKNPTHHAEFYPTDGTDDFRQQGMLADAGKAIPFLDAVDIEIIKEEQPAWLQFQSNNLDSIKLRKDILPSVVVDHVNLAPEFTKKGVRLDIEAGAGFYYVSFNMKDKVIGGNKYLRQAMSAAFDREKYIEVLTSGTGKKSTCGLPPGTPDRPNSKVKYDFDLTKAKELLKKAGYPNGEGLAPITFDLRGADTISRQIGDYMQRNWEAIGLKINVIPNTFPAALEKQKQGNFQVFWGGWTLDYPDAENVYQILYGPNKAPGPNEASFDNPEMNKLYEQIAVMPSSPQRAALISKMNDIVQEEVPWAMGYDEVEYYVTHPWLQNFRGNSIIMNRYKYLRIDKEAKKRYLSGN